ncbi:hypothetical protein EHQ53_14045 [Leptospira langatensis]|uniref:Lipoprotein n=1 Tax=Leptospira langatensis TaxID=2484983 RepID=A0ABY2MD91_9LEPT|nr:hypothetical protein [Leptospira langatensis]TGL39639.1 hypothetical protein EHQ53_14045 [Leptospira langatensis]
MDETLSSGSDSDQLSEESSEDKIQEPEPKKETGDPKTKSDSKEDPKEIMNPKADDHFTIRHPSVKVSAKFGIYVDGKEMELDLKDGVWTGKVSEAENKAIVEQLKKEGWSDETYYALEKKTPPKVEVLPAIKAWTFQHPDAGPDHHIDAMIGFRVNGSEVDIEFVRSIAKITDGALAQEMEKQGFLLVDIKR